MTRRKRTPRRERDFDRIDRARKRWKAAVDSAPTPAARVGAAWDMHRAACRLSAEMLTAEMADIYMNAAAAGLVGNAEDMLTKLEECL